MQEMRFIAQHKLSSRHFQYTMSHRNEVRAVFDDAEDPGGEKAELQVGGSKT